MKQVTLAGSKQYEGQSIICWAPDALAVGDKIRWNGAPWTVRAIYSTRLCMGDRADKTERPARFAD